MLARKVRSLCEQGCVYILASRSRNLYAGVTNSLSRRLTQHREGFVPGFTSKYNIFRLVHYEVFGDIGAAIAREKEIKAWRRERKIWLIEKHNPTWRDLAPEWLGIERKQYRKSALRENARKPGKAGPSPPSKIRPGSG